MIIGHEDLIDNFNKMIETNKLSQSILLVGDRYMGKKFLSKKLAELLKKPFEILEQSIDAL